MFLPSDDVVISVQSIKGARYHEGQRVADASHECRVERDYYYCDKDILQAGIASRYFMYCIPDVFGLDTEVYIKENQPPDVSISTIYCLSPKTWESVTGEDYLPVEDRQKRAAIQYAAGAHGLTVSAYLQIIAQSEV